MINEILSGRKTQGNHMMFRGKRKPAIYNLHQLPTTAQLYSFALQLNQSTIHLSLPPTLDKKISIFKKNSTNS
jgi:hypothetical protein